MTLGGDSTWSWDSVLWAEPRREEPRRNGAGKSGHEMSEMRDDGESSAVCGRGVDTGDCRTSVRPPGRRSTGSATSNGVVAMAGMAVVCVDV